jgi:xylose isomerase
MRSYMIFKEKAERFNADAEIQGLLAEITKADPEMEKFDGAFTPEKAEALKAYSFDRKNIAARGLGYEKLDQLTNELLMGVR